MTVCEYCNDFEVSKSLIVEQRTLNVCVLCYHSINFHDNLGIREEEKGKKR